MSLPPKVAAAVASATSRQQGGAAAASAAADGAPLQSVVVLTSDEETVPAGCADGDDSTATAPAQAAPAIAGRRDSATDACEGRRRTRPRRRVRHVTRHGAAISASSARRAIYEAAARRRRSAPFVVAGRRRPSGHLRGLAVPGDAGCAFRRWFLLPRGASANTCGWAGGLGPATCRGRAEGLRRRRPGGRVRARRGPTPWCSGRTTTARRSESSRRSVGGGGSRRKPTRKEEIGGSRPADGDGDGAHRDDNRRETCVAVGGAGLGTSQRPPRRGRDGRGPCGRAVRVGIASVGVVGVVRTSRVRTRRPRPRPRAARSHVPSSVWVGRPQARHRVAVAH